jgi:type II secretory pathway component PulF
MKPSRIQLSGKDRLLLFSNMSTMLTAGIPILETVDGLAADSKGSLKKVVEVLRQSLLNGEPLSRGMSRLPRSFDAVTLNIMRAAEAGGTLEETLQNIVQTQKKEMTFSDTIRIAMIYPIFIGVIFMGIIVLMLTFVVPRISSVFLTMRVNIPPFTMAMFAASDFFVGHWLLVSIAFIVFITLLYLIIKANRRVFIAAVLSLPVLSQLGVNIDLARMTRSFSLLLRSGVALDEALALTKRVVNKPQIVRIIEHMQQNIEGGKSLASGLRDTHSLLPPIMARSLETAEKSGTLETTMLSLADYFDEQVTGSLKVVSSLIEPIMIVVIGCMVGLLMVSVIAPIYGLISQTGSTSR